MTRMRRPCWPASSDSTRSTIARPLKSGVAAGGSARPVVAGGLTDRAEQGQPELLGVVLVALHLHDGEPVRLARTVGPGTQQRRLPAAGRSRDDRHLPRRRAIQSGEKITPVDQPERSSIHRQRPALVPAPDALPSAAQPSRYQGSARSVNGAQITRGERTCARRVYSMPSRALAFWSRMARAAAGSIWGSLM